MLGFCLLKSAHGAEIAQQTEVDGYRWALKQIWFNTKFNSGVSDEEFFKLYSNPNNQDEKGNTIAHLFAMLWDNRRIIDKNERVNAAFTISIWQALTKAHKLNLEIVDNDHQTPLHAAAQRADAILTERYILPLLLQYAADNDFNINKQNQLGLTPLHIAARIQIRDSSKILAEYPVEHFLNRRIMGDLYPDLDVLDNDGFTPLENAMFYRHFGNAKLLIAHGANVQRILDKDYHFASSEKERQIVKLLQAIIAALSDTVLQTSHLVSHPRLQSILDNHHMDAKAYIANEKTPRSLVFFDDAVWSISFQAKPQGYFNKPASRDFVFIFTFSLSDFLNQQENSAPNDNLSVVHHFATMGKELSLGKLKDCWLILCESAPDLTLKTEDGLTPIHIAASQANLRNTQYILRLFLDYALAHDFDPNPATAHGVRPLHLASCVQYNDDFYSVFPAEFFFSRKLQRIIAIDALDDDGFSALEYAMFNACFGNAEILITNGANVGRIIEKDYSQFTQNEHQRRILTLYKAIVARLSDKIAGTGFLDAHPYLRNFLDYYAIDPMTFVEKAELPLVVVADF